jgi:hypothetical protein
MIETINFQPEKLVIGQTVSYDHLSKGEIENLKILEIHGNHVLLGQIRRNAKDFKSGTSKHYFEPKSGQLVKIRKSNIDLNEFLVSTDQLT